jgi:hypothetical protein
MTTKYEVCRCDECTNKRLVDAAPALLAALKELVDYDEGSSEEETYGLEVWQRCKAVIAKAEGRTDEE